MTKEEKQLDFNDLITPKHEDMTGHRCEECHKGRYQETSIQDDWDGVLHCPKCGHEVRRWRVAG